MEVMDMNVQNTFVFTEQVLPGYTARNKAKADALAQGIPTHLLRRKEEKQAGPQQNERGKKGQAAALQQRRNIPSTFDPVTLCVTLPS